MQPHSPLYADSQFVTELYAEVLGAIAQSRFTLVKRRFQNEFSRLKLNISPMQQQQQQQQQQQMVSSVAGQPNMNLTLSTSNLSSSVGASNFHYHPSHHHQQSLSSLTSVNSGNSLSSLAASGSVSSSTPAMSSQLSGSQLILPQSSSTSTAPAGQSIVQSGAVPIPGVSLNGGQVKSLILKISENFHYS